jgi:hypothetical protein
MVIRLFDDEEKCLAVHMQINSEEFVREGILLFFMLHFYLVERLFVEVNFKAYRPNVHIQCFAGTTMLLCHVGKT